jgi:hypothetical protein
MGGATFKEFFGNPILANRGAFMEQPRKHELVCAFGLGERQSVAPKNSHCHVQELESEAFGAVIVLPTRITILMPFCSYCQIFPKELRQKLPQYDPDSS